MKFLPSVLVALLVSSGGELALGLTVAWNANPAADLVTVYELTVSEVFGMATSTYQTAATKLSISGLSVGTPYTVRVRARNVIGWSEPSEFLAVTPQLRMTFQFSTDLTTWENLKTVTGPKAFVRVKSEPP